MNNPVTDLMRRWRAARRLLTLRSFGSETEAARALERARLALLSTLAATTARLISILTLLVTTPLTLHHLGVERYGMWMTIGSMVSLLAFADLGIGNGVVTAIAHLHGRGERAGMAAVVSNAFGALTLIAAMLLTLFALAYRFVDFAALFNVRGVLARQEAGPACAAFIILFCLDIPAAVIQRVQLGLQRAFTISLWQCAASILSLACVWGTVVMGGSVGAIIVAFTAPSLLASIANSATFFLKSAPDLRPARRHLALTQVVALTKTGGLYLIIAVTFSLTYMSNNFMIAQLLGASTVASYAVPDRIFGVLAAITNIAVMPLWPAYGEAIARGDRRWAWVTFKRSVVLVGGGCLVMGLVLSVVGPWLVRIWVSGTVTTSFALLLGFALWRTGDAVWSCCSVFMNGAGLVRFQAITTACFGVVGFAVKLVATREAGLLGLVWSLAASTALLLLLPALIGMRGWGRAGVLIAARPTLAS